MWRENSLRYFCSVRVWVRGILLPLCFLVACLFVSGQLEKTISQYMLQNEHDFNWCCLNISDARCVLTSPDRTKDGKDFVSG